MRCKGMKFFLYVQIYRKLFLIFLRKIMGDLSLYGDNKAFACRKFFLRKLLNLIKIFNLIIGFNFFGV